MRHVLRSASVVLLLAACSSRAVPPVPPPPVPPPDPPPAARLTPDAPFRQQAPPSGPPVVFKPPAIAEARLSNGVRVLLVERHELPVVALQVVVDRGADQGTPGLGGFVGATLLGGTKTRDALAISDAFEGLGAEYGADVDFDAISLQLKVLSNRLDDALDVVGDIVKNAAYPKEEVERARSRRLTALAQEKDSPARLLSNTVAAMLYPANHPYHSSLLGDETGLGKVSSEDLQKFHKTQFQPNHTTVAVAGDITKAAIVEKLEKALGDWKGQAPAAVVPALPPKSKDGEPRIVLVDRPGATQSSVAVTVPGVARSTKDFAAILVMNTILGGQFSSRLNLNLREKHAYTYGARSAFDMRHGPGPFVASGAIVRESTAPALGEIFAEVRRLRDEPATDDELADAKKNLVLQLPARFETAGEIAGTLAGLAVYGLPLNEFATRAERIQKVTKDDVRRMAKTYLPDERLRVAIVGDAKVIQEGVKALGLGTMEVR